MRASGLLISRSLRCSIGHAAAVSALCGWTAACAAPVVVYRAPSEALAAQYGRALRVETVAGERYTIYQGSVRNDTLHAIRVDPPVGADSIIAIPLRDVSSLTRVDRGMSGASAVSVGLLLGLFAGVVLTVLALMGLNSMT